MAQNKTLFEMSDIIHDCLMAKKPFVFISEGKMLANVNAQGIGMMIATAVILYDVDQFDLQAGFDRGVHAIKESAQTSADNE